MTFPTMSQGPHGGAGSQGPHGGGGSQGPRSGGGSQGPRSGGGSPGPHGGGAAGSVVGAGGAEAGQLPHLGGLDGLRALAVAAVLAYHAELPWAVGGFLGVEVFFVISGYLITALLLAEWRATGGIDLRRFWLRRARRLLPALLAVLAVVVVVAVVFLPGEVARLRGEVAASLGYVANWEAIFSQRSYFETTGRPSMVAHLWSLGVEEQFYLLWPLVLAGGLRFLGRRGLPVAVLGVALASSTLMWLLYEPGGDPSRVYYGTDTRAAGIFLGATLAFVWAPWRLRTTVGRGARWLLDAAGGAALAILVLKLAVTDEASDALYRGGFLGVDVVTLVVLAVAVHPAAHLGRVLGVAPLRWVGLRSYGLYLWHWPVYVLTRPGLDVPFDGVPLLALRLGATVALAELSYRYLEVPVRQGALGRWVARTRARGWQATLGFDGRRWAPARAARATCLAATTGLAVVVAVAVVRAEPPALPPELAAVVAGDRATAARPDQGPPAASADAVVPTPPGTTGDPASSVVPGAGDPGVVSPAPSLGAPDVDPALIAPPIPEPAAAGPAAVPVIAGSVTAVGDSVMAGASAELAALGPGVTVDAAVARQVREGLAVLATARDQGTLGDTVVIHLGNNGTFSAEQFDEIMEVLQGHRVIFLTVNVPRRWEEPNNEVIRDGVARHPGAVLVDWRSISDGDDALFYEDGMHLSAAGAQRYAMLVADAR